ncbi:type II toxin-antitoxin system RelE/ParE family toxin [Gloeobacter morelensis]|uniref:Toxin n=1 Tax=Gloeobacter morelensis MG652769 TaxID=2781736 RepID=A0ABY3PS10_9CYAN|nr:type II toxin-antitoxin system RelE/ParE family toxin [Gloeobacter morelensis MG652769]
MAAFRLTELAVQDLRAVGRYTEATWGRAQRNNYLAKLDACFELLAQEPQLGRVCDDIRPGYRKYHVGRHLIFCRERDTGLKIIRVLHERMDIVSHLEDD